MTHMFPQSFHMKLQLKPSAHHLLTQLMDILKPLFTKRSNIPIGAQLKTPTLFGQAQSLSFMKKHSAL